MELVYLWVEEYKNIEKQGFNFSPRFKCEYDDESNELTIDDKSKDYTSIFPHNINVTAIVGENGSGKSSILECLQEVFKIENQKLENSILIPEHTFNFILKFYMDNELYEIKNIKDHFETNIINNENIVDLMKYYAYSNFNNKFDMFKLNRHSIAEKLISNDKILDYDFEITSFMFLPNKVEISLCDFYTKFDKLISDSKRYPLYPNQSDHEYLLEMNQEIKSAMKAFENETNMYYKFVMIQNLKYDNGFEERITEEEFNEYFSLTFPNNIKLLNDLTIEEEKIYYEYNDFFNFNFIDKVGRSYDELSHGEQIIFGQLLNIYFYSKQNEDNLIFLLDEPEISLHPNWQKKYLNESINLCKKFNNKYHFITTSHSPFILSDLPKDNVIFLKDGKQEYPFKDKQTFGANIHTLLSDGFFMSDGLMGEFAKNKIRTITVAHKYVLFKHNKEYLIHEKNRKLIIDNINNFWEIHKIIGEPFLQKVVNNCIQEIELILLNKIESIDNEIERLKELKKSLNNG